MEDFTIKIEEDSINIVVNGGLLTTSAGGIGADGKSAYQLALDEGYVGTLQEWLESLNGSDGEDGADGINGEDGADGINGEDGLSAYEVAVASGFAGTQTEWLDSLKAKPSIVVLAPEEDVPEPPQDGVIYLRVGSSGPQPDTTPPSVPSELTASGITSSAFTVSWSESTDNVAVAGYEIRIDGGSPVAKTDLAHPFTGLTPETEYQVQVRARDIAGNWSAWSAPLVINTQPAPEIAAASVWGDNPWPDPVNGNTDGPATTYGAFYTSRPEGMNVLGARVFLPEGLASSFYNTNISVWTLVLSHAHAQGRPPGDLSTHVAQNGMTAPLVPGWNEILFEAPVHVNQFASGEDNAIWIGIRYETGPNYLTAPRVTLSDNSIEFPDAPGVYKGYPFLPEYGNNIVGIQNGVGPYPIDILVEP